MIKIEGLFDVSYGNSLELNRLTIDPVGINFVSRTAKNNGVSAKVSKVEDIEPIEAGVITVALGGSVLETFFQPEPFYTGFHVAVLRAKVEMTDAVKLYYCACIRANMYRYNYGRQANRTLKDIPIPCLEEVPDWVNGVNVSMYDGADNSALNTLTPGLNSANFKSFQLQELFELKKGKRLTKANMTVGQTPFIGSTDSGNGVTATVGQAPIHSGNTISVSYNGSVAEAFYQPVPYWATDDVNVLYPRFAMTPEVALFICTVIKQEKYRFNYGRKWHLERMRSHEIRLPGKPDGSPDYDFMENYIKTLPYSSQI